MKNLLLFAVLVTLPLLLGGCGEKESVGEVKPVVEIPLNSNLKYEIKGDAVTITGCDKKASGTITIPVSIEGKPVTSIGEKAFNGCRSLTSITIPDGVTSIRYMAFNGCRSLTSITIPDSVTSIGDSAFYYCKGLTSITIGDGVTTIGWYAFGACESLTEITIPDSVTSLRYMAFEECTSLTAVTFLGDAPSASKEVFKDSVPTIYRKPEAKGWGDAFKGRPVKLINEKP